jgi:hypothetical protein
LLRPRTTMEDGAYGAATPLSFFGGILDRIEPLGFKAEQVP